MSSSETSSSESKLQTAKAVIAAVGSAAAALVVVRSFAKDLLPDEFHHYVSATARSFFGWFSSDLTFVIEEFDGIESNHIYDSATRYLGTLTKSAAASAPRRLKISKPESDTAVNVTVDRDELISDSFDGVRYTWTLVCRRVESKFYYNPRDMSSTLRSELRSLELTFHKKHKEKALGRYIPFVIEEAKRIKEESKTIKLHTVNEDNLWSGLCLNHPATFDTIAMDPEEKRRIEKDLERFLERKEYYTRVGKAWKRGYLLYGPPGTGKSSLIAAIANKLRFDVYDLELGALNGNADLRTLLLATENRSILVVEDIDCSVQLKNREEIDSSPPASQNEPEKKRVTLSGFLNFVDGLWSSCGDERIIIFTSNYKDKLDPALLRPGRMDMHIHMSYCTPSAFKVLANNYLGVRSHGQFGPIEELIAKVQVTPAEVAEQLMKEDNVESALDELIGFLKAKGRANKECKPEDEDNIKRISDDG